MTQKIENLKYYSCHEYDGPETNITLKKIIMIKSNTNISNQTIYIQGYMLSYSLQFFI
jgi:hypothetical protein